MADVSKGSSVTYFVVKSYTKEGLIKSRSSKEWACSARIKDPQPVDLLGDAFATGRVCLIFSVNSCHGWHGYGYMTTPPDKHARFLDSNSGDSKHGQLQQRLWHKYNIEWRKLLLDLHQEQCVKFTATKDLMCDDGITSVNEARNYQVINGESGAILCSLIDEKYADLSQQILDKKKETEAKKPPPFFKLTGENSNCSQELHTEVWQKILDQVNELGKVMVACAFGSQRYNCHNAESDMDMFIVYKADTARLLGFNQPQHTIKNREGEAFDYTILEVQRFCELLLAGDPRCVETLYLHPSSIFKQTDEWQELVRFKDLFLTKQVCEKYLNDATGAKGTRLMDKWVKNGDALAEPMQTKVGKLFYIIIRLLQNAMNIVSQHGLTVYRPDESEERQLLLAARAGTRTYAKLRQVVNSMVEDLTSKLSQHSWTRLDSTEARAKLETWLVRKRYENLHRTMISTDILET